MHFCLNFYKKVLLCDNVGVKQYYLSVKACEIIEEIRSRDCHRFPQLTLFEKITVRRIGWLSWGIVEML